MYEIESFRSYVLDQNEDIEGKCANPDTIKKLDRILEIIQNDYEMLRDKQGLFWGDENLTKGELIKKYSFQKKMAIKYQQEDLSGYNIWIENRIKSIINNYSIKI